MFSFFANLPVGTVASSHTYSLTGLLLEFSSSPRTDGRIDGPTVRPPRGTLPSYVKPGQKGNKRARSNEMQIPIFLKMNRRKRPFGISCALSTDEAYRRLIVTNTNKYLCLLVLWFMLLACLYQGTVVWNKQE